MDDKEFQEVLRVYYESMLGAGYTFGQATMLLVDKTFVKEGNTYTIVKKCEVQDVRRND